MPDPAIPDADRALMEEGLKEFDAGLDEYMREWEASLRAAFGRSGERDYAEDDAPDPDESAELMADVLYGLFGDAALDFICKDSEKGHESFAGKWDALRHPRGPNGRFIPRGSAEAVSAAREVVGKVLKGEKTQHSAEEVARHLAILTVPQLRELHKQHGVKAPGKLREELVEAIKGRMGAKGGPGEGGSEGAAGGDPEPGAPFLPGRPIAERLAAYKGADAAMAKIAKVRSDYRELGGELAAAKDAQERAWSEHVLATHEHLDSRKAKGAGHADTLALKKKRDDALKARRDAAKRSAALSEAVRVKGEGLRAEYLDALRARTPTPLAADVLAAPEKIRRNFGEGRDWVSAVLEGGPGAFEGRLRVEEAEPSHTAGGWGGRASCNGRPDDFGGESVVRLSEGEYDAGVAVHEIGHALENHCPGAGAAAREFLAHRVGSEAPRRLNEVAPGSKYRDDEVGRLDSFGGAFGDRGWYCGKVYKDGSTEILSMGLQELYDHPVEFCERDPEYAKFVIGVLKGHLR